MQSIFWGNYKGGVGKTTSTFQIAGHFALQGKKVLLIDLDPQCSLSDICCRGEGLDKFRVDETLNYILELYMRDINGNHQFAFQLLSGTEDSDACNEYRVVQDCIKQTIQTLSISLQYDSSNKDIFFIPSCLHLPNCRMNELAQYMSENVYNIFLIKLFLNAIRELGKDEKYKFDYVFFDCPPTTNILTQSVFLASDYYIIPTICDEVSTNGVPDYIAEIEKTRNKYSLNDKIRGVLMEKAFPNKPHFVGVFETLYKMRRKDSSPQNYPIIQELDNYICNILDKIEVQSLLSEPQFENYRYDPKDSDNPEQISTKHIFKESIDHKDARKKGESVAHNTANAVITEAYGTLASMIMDMITK